MGRTSASVFAVALALGGCATAENAGGDAAGNGPDGSFSPIDAAVATPDAASGIPDAPVPVIDAAPPADVPTPTVFDAAVIIDAAPPAIDAACTPTIVQLLVNPAFDLGPGAPWVEASPAGQMIRKQNPDAVLDADELPMANPPHTPIWAAWLGGYDSFGSEVDTLHQAFVVPVGATNLQITGFRWFQSQESGAFDFARLQLRTSTGGLLETFVGAGGWSSTDVTATWQSFAFAPAGSYAGQTIRLHIEAEVDFSLQTDFFFDSLSVTATVCL